MVVSRAQARELLDHIYDNVFGLEEESPLRLALEREGISTVEDLLTLRDLDVESLEYPYDDEGLELMAPLPRGYRNLIRVFSAYVAHRIENGDPVTDWKDIDQDMFDNYRVSTYGRTPPHSSTFSNTPLVARSTAGTSSHRVQSQADLFRRGIKRDPNLFPTLKDERLNDSWHRSFGNQARAQNVYNILISEYKPGTTEETELFDEQQKYLYAVLESHVLTDRGKAIVREHESDFDAQSVYRKLQAHHLTSTKAMIDSSDILAYITSACLGNTGSWRGTTEAFILHWQNQVRLYERQVESVDHFSGTVKRTMLQNAVSPIDELRQVKNNADLAKAQPDGRALTYEEYTALVLSAATAYDSQFHQKRSTKQQRQAMTHDVYYEDDYQYVDDTDAVFDIDAPVDTISAYAAERRSRHSPHARNHDGPRPTSGGSRSGSSRPRVPFDRWSQLSAADRSIWNQLDDRAKALLLGLSSSHPDASNNTTPGPAGGARRSALLHDRISPSDDVHVPSVTDHDVNTDIPSAESLGVTDLLASSSDSSQPDSNILVNAATRGSPLPPGDIRRVMSRSSTRSAQMAHTTYHVTAHHSTRTTQSLIDRGANGGIAGLDVRTIHSNHKTVNIRGIDNHEVSDIRLGSVGGVVHTDKGPVIAIMHNYALLGKGHTIHSPGQFEWFKNAVDDKSVRVGGLQRIRTLDGYLIPLDLHDGLARLTIRPYTDSEWNTLPHVFLTNESDWDPTVLDYSHNMEEWVADLSDLDTDPHTNLFDAFGNYRKRVTVQHAAYFHRLPSDTLDDTIDACVYHAQHADSLIHDYTTPAYPDTRINDTPFTAVPLAAHEHHIQPTTTAHTTPRMTVTKEPDFSALRPLFGWLSADIIKSTFQHTTQYARLPTGTLLKRSFKSANPALNVLRRSEPTACDIVYADTPAIDNGSTAAVIFTGTTSHVTDVYGIKTDKQFVNTLEDNIRIRGAPTKLISDRAQVEIGTKVKDILRSLVIGAWQSEPHQQQQNPAERRYQTIKTAANRILDRTGAPSSTWLLCLVYVCYLLNHTFNQTIRDIPLTRLTGVTVDISPLLRFHFWQHVYYALQEPHFPSESREGSGRIVGISEHVGPAMTWKILTDDTRKIIYRSIVRPSSSTDPNLRVDPSSGEISSLNDVIKSNDMDTKQLNTDPDANATNPGETNTTDDSNVFNIEQLIGQSFLIDTKDNGERLRARVVELVKEHDDEVKKDPSFAKFKCSVNNDEYEELISYNQLIGYLSRDKGSNDIVWKFKRISSHQGPLKADHTDYKGCPWNVLVEWENGEITAEPLSVIAADDPVTCAIYAKDNDLLDVAGWKRFKSIAKRKLKFTRLVNQAKLRSFRTAPRFKYGFEVPRNYAHAVQIDEQNGNTRWQDATVLELAQINEYQAFSDRGHKSKSLPPEGYKRIRVHLVFDVKHDGRHKARLVADGHLTEIPVDSVYSGVVTLRGFRLVLFLAELNGLESWATDIGNAYLEAKTSEKVYVIAGPEFGEIEGHILVIHKALYGLRSSGARWHDKFSDCLRDLGFEPCKAEPDIWLRKNNGIYEYIATYVDDLCIALRKPQEFVDALEKSYKFKLKGTGPISFHLGMDFYRDDTGSLCIAPKKYIEKMVNNYKRIFGEAPKQVYKSPLESGDHPEIDTSDLLKEKDIVLYQSLIGALQWIVTIGRFDVQTSVMTLSSFRAAPRKGHLDRIKRIYGYLYQMRHACIRIRTEEPDFSDLPDTEYDWSRSVYGDVKEMLPTNAPPPLGRFVTTVHYVDANLMHDLTTGRSVTGILHLVNKTPIDWYSRKAATVETATYGSEIVAARTCVEQIIDLRQTLRYLGVPVRSKCYMFGDNESVVNSSMRIHAKLHKRHSMLSFHRIREAIASGMIVFFHIPGQVNPADILSKHWSYASIWMQLKTLLFWQNDTADIES